MTVRKTVGALVGIAGWVGVSTAGALIIGIVSPVLVAFVIGGSRWVARQMASEIRQPIERQIRRLEHRMDEFALELQMHDARVRGSWPRRASDPDDADWEHVRGEIPPTIRED